MSILLDTACEIRFASTTLPRATLTRCRCGSDPRIGLSTSRARAPSHFLSGRQGKACYRAQVDRGQGLAAEGNPEWCSFVSSDQLLTHVLAYAEVLFRWKLLHKRIELLKAVDPFFRPPSDSTFNLDHSQLGVSFLCTQCGEPTTSRTQSACSACGAAAECPDVPYAASLSKVSPFTV
ncbi:hypothetical protein EDB84DRAFT_1011221 [Lactarius hengduanensis]|nr:hypothetical protein EDB84DRAFT_1011221 [Lactarius hengduanensis]